MGAQKTVTLIDVPKTFVLIEKYWEHVNVLMTWLIYECIRLIIII